MGEISAVVAAGVVVISLMISLAGAIECPGPGGTCSNETHCYRGLPIRSWMRDSPSCGQFIAASGWDGFCNSADPLTRTTARENCAIACGACSCDNGDIYCSNIDDSFCSGLTASIVRPLCPRLCSYCPTVSPTMSPTVSPSQSPTYSTPTESPTASPTRSPTIIATANPSSSPTAGAVQTIIRENRNRNDGISLALLIAAIAGGVLALGAMIFAAVVYVQGRENDDPNKSTLTNYVSRFTHSLRSIRNKKNPVYRDSIREGSSQSAGNSPNPPDTLMAISSGVTDYDERTPRYRRPVDRTDSQHTLHEYGFVRKPSIKVVTPAGSDGEEEGYIALTARNSVHNSARPRYEGEYVPGSVPTPPGLQKGASPPPRYLDLKAGPSPPPSPGLNDDGKTFVRTANGSVYGGFAADGDAIVSPNSSFSTTPVPEISEMDVMSELPPFPPALSEDNGLVRTVGGSVYGGFSGDNESPKLDRTSRTVSFESDHIANDEKLVSAL